MHIIRLARERENAFRNQGNFQKNYQGGSNQEYPQQEVARPVLGTQPPPPGTVAVRYADTEYPETGAEMVLVEPYVQDPAIDWLIDQTQGSGYYQEEERMESNQVMLVGQMPEYPQQMQQSQGYPSRKFQQAPPKLKCY